MIDISDIKRRLARLGLTKNQADIYLLLLQRGNSRVTDFVNILKIPRSSVYENLKGLYELGLAEEIVENSFKRIRAYPLSLLKHRLNEDISKLKEQSADLERLEKELEEIPSDPNQTTTTVRYYKGIAGARQIFWNTLKSKDVIYVYGEWGRSQYLGVEFYKNFVTESYERNFQEQVLTNSTLRVLDSIRAGINGPTSRTKIENVKVLPVEAVAFTGDTLIYDDIYAQVFLKDEVINGFEIQSEQFVKTQRAIFESLWKSATKLSELL